MDHRAGVRGSRQVSDRPAPYWERVGRVGKLLHCRVQWDDLRVFLAVAQAGSLRRAARALHLGQPTVVRHLRQLEHGARARLFERTPDGHRLTTWGQDLLPMAQSMADAATAIDRRGGPSATTRAASCALAAERMGAPASSRRAWRSLSRRPA